MGKFWNWFTGRRRRAMPPEWIELRSPDGKAMAALLPLDASKSEELRRRLVSPGLGASTLLPGFDLAASLVGPLAAASPAIQTALAGGQVFQIIGPPQLVAGLKSGTLQLMQSGGALGTVVDASSRVVVGQARFAAMSPAWLVAPILVYQIAHVILSTIQLHQINKRLAAIEYRLAKMDERRHAEDFGRILWAQGAVEDLFAELENTGVYTSEMLPRLAHVEAEVGTLLQTSGLLVETFKARADDAIAKKERKGAEHAAEVLRGGAEAQLDMKKFAALASLDLKVCELRTYCSLQLAPADTVRRIESTRAKVAAYEKQLAQLPSLETVKDHAENCLREMSWFSRLWNWPRVIDVQNVMKMAACSDSDADAAPKLTPQASYLIWQEDCEIRGRAILESPAELQAEAG
jgi:hypothetical protein